MDQANYSGFFKCVLPFFLVFLLSGCNTPETQNISDEDISNLLDITYIKGPEIIKGEYVAVTLENKSDYCLSFPSDYGIRIFGEMNGELIEIDDLMETIGEYKETPEIVDYKYGLFTTMSIIFVPDTQKLALLEPTDFYAIISGTLCEDDSVSITKKILFTVLP